LFETRWGAKSGVGHSPVRPLLRVGSFPPPCPKPRGGQVRVRHSPVRPLLRAGSFPPPCPKPGGGQVRVGHSPVSPLLRAGSLFFNEVITPLILCFLTRSPPPPLFLTRSYPLMVSFPLPCPNPRGGVPVRNRTSLFSMVISSPLKLIRKLS